MTSSYGEINQEGTLFIGWFLDDSQIRYILHSTVKVGDKERSDKEKNGVKEPYPVTILLNKDNEDLALGNTFRVTKKFFITKSKGQ